MRVVKVYCIFYFVLSDLELLVQAVYLKVKMIRTVLKDLYYYKTCMPLNAHFVSKGDGVGKTNIYGTPPFSKVYSQ